MPTLCPWHQKLTQQRRIWGSGGSLVPKMKVKDGRREHRGQPATAGQGMPESDHFLPQVKESLEVFHS